MDEQFEMSPGESQTPIEPGENISSDLEFEKIEDLAAPVEPNEEIDVVKEDLTENLGPRRSRKRRKLFCFHCHRPESHSLSAEHRWYYSFVIGMTFGLIKIIGPYQCHCCGAKRLMISNALNLRFWYQDRKLRRKK